MMTMSEKERFQKMIEAINKARETKKTQEIPKTDNNNSSTVENKSVNHIPTVEELRKQRG